MADHGDPATCLEVDEDDPTLGDEIASSTQSLQSSLLKFEFENGRRYHAFQSGRYAFPNDEDELERMDLEHQIFLMLLDGQLHLAPLTSPQRILDLGTGTGVWAVDMADKYPSATVLGTDLSPVQPRVVPPNAQFQVDDFELEWTFRENSFDMIHWRLLLASVSDYPTLVRNAFNHLKPGGYLEIHDLDPGFYSDDNSIPEGSSALHWSECFYQGCAKAGRTIPPIEQYRTFLEDAGFENIHVVLLKRPQNVWPKDRRLKRIGMYTLVNHLNGLHGFTVGLFTRVLGWSPEEVDVLISKCRTEWKDPAIHGYQKVIALYGQKSALLAPT